MNNKIFLAALIFTLISMLGYSQSVNDVPISDIKVEYIEIVGSFRTFTNKVAIQLDFGQEVKFLNEKNTLIKDQYGQIMTFNSMVGALNFMSENGYDYVDTYIVTDGDFVSTHYLLKKRKNQTNP